MTTEGARVRTRRERLGLHKGELAEAAGVNRDTLAAIEAGEGFRRVSLTKIERALDELEAEAGIGAPPAAPAIDQGGPSMVTFRLGKLTGDVDVVVEGRIEDIDTLRETVERLLHAASGASSENDRGAAVQQRNESTGR